jgi:Na+-transporting NADH:ubiquinone oxidoreductase subunit NqrC
MLLAILLVSCAALIVAAASLVILRARHRRLTAEVNDLIARVEEMLRASGSLVEVKSFYDEFLGELKALLEEAYQVKDKKRVQQFQRMRDRLESFKARVLDKAIQAAEKRAETEKGDEKRGKRGRTE